jgi:hypothetical protein
VVLALLEIERASEGEQRERERDKKAFALSANHFCSSPELNHFCGKWNCRVIEIVGSRAAKFDAPLLFLLP